MADEASAPSSEAVVKDTSPPAGAADPASSDDEPVVVPVKAGGESSTPPKAAEDAAPTSDAAKETSERPQAEPGTTREGQKKDETPAADAAQTNGASSKKKDKRKSGAGVPEHKSKKLNRKKSEAQMHLDVEPGEFWFVQMKGYPPWPAVICDEEMLPITLLEKRPVSAKQVDGHYRADYAAGGKNQKDRRYPVMFLGTNEFAWHINTDLSPLDVSDIKEMVGKEQRGKKSKQLWEAYKVAAEEHDLQYFKDMLHQHDQEVQRLLEEEEAKEAAKAAKAAKKKAKEEAAAAAAQADIEMEDAEEAPVKPKSASKKRKKEADSEGEAPKPAKTPKIKLNGPKEPATEEVPSTKKKASKPKKPKKPVEEVKAPATPPMTEEERREKKEKMVLYLRHKLQKGFLTRDQTPKEEEMDMMDEQFKNLEKLADLEASIIRATKINKVLKAILKLDHIPKEHEHHFKNRSRALLDIWAPTLGLPEEPKSAAAAPTTNGVKHDEPEAKAEKPAAAEKASEPTAGTSEPPTEAKDGDVSMHNAPQDEAVAEA